jgi:hypothetical protein
MFAELAGAAQSVQALSTILKAANGLSNYNEIVTAVSDVNAKLMQANVIALSSQEKQLELMARIKALEEEITALNQWGEEVEKYHAIEIARGVFAQLEKTSSGSYESAQKFCCNCFSENKKSLLQQSNEDVRQKGLRCHRCRAHIVFRHYSDQT